MSGELGPGQVAIRLQIKKETRAALVRLAGSKARMGQYLDSIIPVIEAAQARIAQAEQDGRVRAVAFALLENEADG